jgi:hypothetical protein
MSRIGLGRHSSLGDEAGDPLDGLVNLFDVGMILAVAFLIAGLGLTLKGGELTARHREAEDRAPTRGASKERVIQDPASGPPAAGRGTAVGQVYRLPDGRLLYVKHPSR